MGFMEAASGLLMSETAQMVGGENVQVTKEAQESKDSNWSKLGKATADAVVPDDNVRAKRQAKLTGQPKVKMQQASPLATMPEQPIQRSPMQIQQAPVEQTQLMSFADYLNNEKMR